jgi:hypothetical protein
MNTRINFRIQSNEKLKTWSWKKARNLGTFHGFGFRKIEMACLFG